MSEYHQINGFLMRLKDKDPLPFELKHLYIEVRRRLVSGMVSRTTSPLCTATKIFDDSSFQRKISKKAENRYKTS